MVAQVALGDIAAHDVSQEVVTLQDEFRRPVVGFFTAMLCLTAFLIVAGLVAATTHSDGVRNVALGVIGSLLASIVFAALSEFADTPTTRAAAELQRTVGEVRAIEHNARARLQAGVVSVSDKRAHQPDYWFAILGTATDRLDMVGNSLSGWVQGEFRTRLKAAIARILANGGQVRIVFMDPDAPVANAKSDLLGKNYASHINDFVRLLGEIKEEFEKSFEAGHLAIVLAKDPLAYMMIDTGRDIYVSPYMSVTRAGHPLVVQVAGESGFAEGYRADFNRLFDRGKRAGARYMPQRQ